MDVKLREIKREDFPLLLAWAHIKEVWTYLPTSRKSENLTWEGHFSWWESRISRVDWMILVNFGYGARPVGVVHVKDLETDHPEVGLYIGEVTLWGKGISRRALELVIERVNRPRLWAVIHPENKRSIRLFTDLGFKKEGRARNGQDLYKYSSGRPKIPVPVLETGDRRSLIPVPA